MPGKSQGETGPHFEPRGYTTLGHGRQGRLVPHGMPLRFAPDAQCDASCTVELPRKETAEGS
jgi:hypothetical protein